MHFDFSIPYDELVQLEVDRRGQNINFKARLVNQGESGAGFGSGAHAYTAPQQISGDGKDPQFEKEEEERKMQKAKRRMKEQMENSDRCAEL